MADLQSAATASSAGGASAVSIADGSSVALGAKSDTAATSDTGTFSLIALFKRLLSYFGGSAITEAITLSITTGGTRQQVFAANASRRSFGFSNTSDTIQYVRFGANAADKVGVAVNPAGFIILENSSCPVGAIDVICATTGKTFYAWNA